MDSKLALFFEKMPEALPLYLDFHRKVCTQFPDAKIKIQKSQITFSNKHNFAAVWLPIHRIQNRPRVYFIVTFGLPKRVISPRIVEAVQPYPARWTHHVIVQHPDEIDSELLDWIESSYKFSLQK